MVFVQEPRTTTWEKAGRFDYHDAPVEQVKPEAVQQQENGTQIQIPWVLIIIGLIVLVVLFSGK